VRAVIVVICEAAIVAHRQRPSRQQAAPKLTRPMKSPATQSSFLPDTAPPENPDRALVFDALAFSLAPTTANQLIDLLGAAGCRTARGAGFHNTEVRRLLDELAELGQASRDERGRWSAARDAGWQRFRALVQDPTHREFWWRAWRKRHNFDNAWGLDIFDSASCAAAMRIVIHCGRSPETFNRFATLVGPSQFGASALRQALLDPFDTEMLGGLDTLFACALADNVLATAGDDSDTDIVALLDWLLAQVRTTPKKVPEHLHYRLAETLLFREQFSAARELLASRPTPESQALRAGVDIAEGHFAEGSARFEAALKALAAETGKRKQLLPPSLAWLYPLALLAQPEPAAWIKARKFAAAEAGKREAQPFTFWGLWQSAIDQRLGDSPLNAKHFQLARGAVNSRDALSQLHHLLLAAWLRIEPSPRSARDRLSEHGAYLETRLRNAGLLWLARLARRAVVQLLGETPAADDAAMPYFIGAAQDRWREALASIVALGSGPAGQREAGAAGDRLIWTVSVDDKSCRITAIEPLEQRASSRGLGKAKPVTLAALIKRKDLPTHDAAVLRAVLREDFGNRPFLDTALAAAALVRHPHVAWASEPQRFIEVVEALPALEVMTRGEHIAFRLVDPLLAPPGKSDDGDLYAYVSPRAQGANERARQTLLIADGIDRARLVRTTPAQLRVAELVTQGWQVPATEKAELDAALRVLATHFQIASDAEAGHEVPASDTLRAELTPRGSGLDLTLMAAPFGDFGPRLAPGSGRARVTTVHQGATLFTRRRLDAERARVSALLQAAEFLDDGVHAWQVDEPEQALALVEALAAQAPGIVSEWPKGKPLRVRPVTAKAVTLNVASRGDWLDIDGELALDDGEVLRLRTLLELVQAGKRRYVALGDGDFLALSDGLRQQLADLNAVVQPHKQGQRVAGIAALAWSHQAGELQLEGDAAWRKRSATWADAQERRFDLPNTLQAELRDYQQVGYRWLMRLAASGFGACLADDMGLGKTLMTLAVLLERAAGGATLVVAPTSVCSNWLAEAARFAPSLDVQMYGDVAEASDIELADDDAAGADPDSVPDTARLAARRRQLRALGAGQVLVCSYALLQRDADLLAGREWHSVVLDEAQAIKNAATRRAKAASRLEAGFRLALTGTPIENRLGELWSIMGFANPGLLGSAEQFTQRFAGPIERDGDAQASRRLRRLVAPFLLRRTKGEVLTDLPPRTEIVHEVVPGKRERALLEVLRQHAEDSVNQVMTEGAAPGQSQIHLLAALTRLRRAACDPRLVAPELGLVGAKVQEFERLAVELVAGKHKALVFSQFTDFLALLRERLDGAGLSYQYLDGGTPAAERGKRVAAFQQGSGDFFLISLKAGGFGLNLTAADYVIIADPWWNPAAEDQASGRAHRIGQLRPVTVYRLVTQGSIEDRIVRLHRSKRELAEGILSGQDGGAVMDAEALLTLLRGDGSAG
jgi:superfamily II DNA or RNA helicase